MWFKSLRDAGTESMFISDEMAFIIKNSKIKDEVVQYIKDEVKIQVEAHYQEVFDNMDDKSKDEVKTYFKDLNIEDHKRKKGKINMRPVLEYYSSRMMKSFLEMELYTEALNKFDEWEKKYMEKIKVEGNED